MINKNTIYEIENNFCIYDDISNLHEKHIIDSKKDDMLNGKRDKLSFLKSEIQKKTFN